MCNATDATDATDATVHLSRTEISAPKRAMASYMELDTKHVPKSDWLAGAEVLQTGEWNDDDAGGWQIGMLWQVNCPGCHMALPVLDTVAEELADDGVRVVAVATAFEDFELNTTENTRRFLTSGVRVGVPARELGEQAGDSRVRVRVVMDRLVEQGDGEWSDAVALVRAALILNLRAELAAIGVVGAHAETVIAKATSTRQFVSQIPARIAIAFWSLGARGTPTWFIRYNSIVHWAATGQLDADQLLGVFVQLRDACDDNGLE